MELVKEGWFTEQSELWPGSSVSLEVEQVLHSERSQYQDILVLQTRSMGRVLVLDGIIQCTEKDEFSYQTGLVLYTDASKLSSESCAGVTVYDPSNNHTLRIQCPSEDSVLRGTDFTGECLGLLEAEMISFLPLCSHRQPEKVLIVGGGDGGVAREVSKHPLVKEIYQVEIDSKVIEASKKWLPWMATGFDSEKLTLHIGDGFEFLKQHRGAFDVIITDSSDPVGPALSLFRENYFALMRSALRPGGIVCSQAGTVWYDLDHVTTTLQHCRLHFAKAAYAYTSVPSYPSGQIGFVLGSLDADAQLETPLKPLTHKQIADMKLRYYNNDTHQAAFVLPNFVRGRL